jgi:hypothetical protein
VDEWETLADFPDYEICHAGKIRNKKTGRILRPSHTREGTLKVGLLLNGGLYTRSLPKLICTHYHGPADGTQIVFFKDNNPGNLDESNLCWKPRWFVQENYAQQKRTKPYMNRRILMHSTGRIFENSLECAKQTGGIEKYIVLAAGNSGRTYYNGSTYEWL